MVTQATGMEPVAQVGLAMDDKSYILSAEEAWDAIDHDQLDGGTNALDAGNPIETNGYSMMVMGVKTDDDTIHEIPDKVDTDSDKIDSKDSDNDFILNEDEQQDQDLLDHALYCTACVTRRNMEDAESRYEVARHQLWMCGITTSSVCCHIVDNVWEALTFGPYCTASAETIQMI